MSWQKVKNVWRAFRGSLFVKICACIYGFINFWLRIAVLALVLYSAAFTVAASIVLYKGFVYVYDLYDSVESLKDTQPEMSKYMQALRDSNPDGDIKHTFVPLDSIHPYLQKAVIASEDAGFYFHPGFDVNAIAEALNANRISGKTKFGGSTITQQLIKNTLLSPEQSYKRKIQEAYLAMQLETRYSKDEILESYLNTIYLGENYYGVQTAAEGYFGRPLGELTLRECAMLAGVTNSPYYYNPRRNF